MKKKSSPPKKKARNKAKKGKPANPYGHNHKLRGKVKDDDFDEQYWRDTERPGDSF